MRIDASANQAAQVLAALRSELGSTARAATSMGDESNRAGDRAGGFIDKIGSLGMGILGVKTLMESVGGIATAMVEGNAEMERYETQLGTLLGGADAAKERLAELAEFGAKTPFELPEVVRAEKVLLGFGLTGEKALKLTGKSGEDLRTVIGDIAAGTGVAFEEIALTWGKFSAGASGEAISRLQELGVATKEQMAEMGVEFDKAGSLVSPLPVAMEAAIKIAESKFGGGMDKLSATFEGQMGTLADGFNAAKRTIMQPIFDVLKEGLGQANEIIGSEAIQNGLVTIGDSLAGIIKGGVDLGQKFIPMLAPIQAFFSDKMEATITGVAAVVGTVLVAAASSAAVALWAMVVPILPIVAALAAVGAAAFALKLAFDNNFLGIRDMVEGVMGAVTPFVTDQINQIVSFVQENWPLIESTINVVMGAVQTFINNVLVTLKFLWMVFGDDITNLVKTAFGLVGSTINYVMTQIMSVIKLGMQVINGDWSGAWETVKEMTKRATDFISGVLDTLFGGIVTNLVTFVSGVTGKWDELRTNLYNGAQGIWDDLRTRWQNIQDNVTKAATDLKDAVIGRFTTLGDEVRTTAGNLKDSLVGPDSIFVRLVADTIAKMTEFGTGIATKLLDVANPDGPILTNARGLAEKIVTDLQNTVTGKLDSIKDTVKNTVSGGIDQAKGLITGMAGVADQVIGNIASALGLDTQWAKVKDELKKTVDNGISQAVNAISGAAELGGKVVNNIVDGIKNAAGSVFNAIRDVINSAIDNFNSNMRTFTIDLPTITVAGIGLVDLPTIGPFGLPGIPRVFKGGIARSATLATVGEQEPEAIIPLSRAKEYGFGAGGGNTYTLNFYGDMGRGTTPDAVVRAMRRADLLYGSAA